jgi:hypothetical protein
MSVTYLLYSFSYTDMHYKYYMFLLITASDFLLLSLSQTIAKTCYGNNPTYWL